ncbi:MAG TPA: hypothetical protein VLB31_05005, partial [Actinomycetota bacterium]|nr:hypothetical protein [Actinomycetota bacterium]
MPKVSFRMASASRESVFDVQTSTARKNHRSDHTEDQLTTTPSRVLRTEGTLDRVQGNARIAEAPLAEEVAAALDATD